MAKLYWVYIPASRKRGALYAGVTNDVNARLHLHRGGGGSAQARRYAIHRLVYVESFADVREAIAREKQIKKWRRQWKIALIESVNPRLGGPVPASARVRRRFRVSSGCRSGAAKQNPEPRDG